MTTTPINDDLNTTIASAVNARVEAAVLEALSGDEVIGRYVTAALREPVKTDRYSSRQETFLHHTVAMAIRAAAKAAVERVLTEDAELIEDEVRKAIRRDVKGIAAQLTQSMTDAAARSYGVNVSLRYPGEG